MKVLLADDEFFVRERVRNEIDWASYGITQIIEAGDGAEALEKFKSFTPDILLTDVRMPHVEGVRLSEEVLGLKPDCKIIFISGYSDKMYLKSAIRLRAIQYVEKPIDMDELAEAISSAAEAIRREQHQDSKMLELEQKNYAEKMNALAAGLTRADTLPAVLGMLPSFVDISECARFLTVIVSLVYADEGTEVSEKNIHGLVTSSFKSERAKCLYAYRRDSVVLHILGYADWEPRDRAVVDEGCRNMNAGLVLNKISAVYSVGKTVNRIEELPLSYDTALKASARAFFHQPGYVIHHNDYSQPPYAFDNFSLTGFAQALKKSDSYDALFLVHILINGIRMCDSTNASDVRRFCFSCALVILRLAKSNEFVLFEEHPEEYDVWTYINGLFFLDGIKDFLLEAVNRYFKCQEAKATDNIIVNRIIKYVSENYGNPDLSIGLIGDYTGLSATYICHLFKNVTGGTLGNYLTETRIKKALELIDDPNIRLKDVAKMVGYRNGNYFSYQFKKHMGYPPSERNANAGGKPDRKRP